MNSSNASLHCRLEWRPSRWLLVGFPLLAVLATISIWLSSLPVWTCVVVSALIAAYATFRLRHEMRCETVVISWAGGDAPVVVEHGTLEQGGRSVEYRFAALNFRAGLVVLCIADDRGRRSRWVWWPDTLDASGRRALRLAASRERDSVLVLSTQSGKV
jgi:toxin CptA